jgi:hypothetical protein
MMGLHGLRIKFWQQALVGKFKTSVFAASELDDWLNQED